MVFKEENSESWREAESWGAYAADGVHGGGGRWVSVSNSGQFPSNATVTLRKRAGGERCPQVTDPRVRRDRHVGVPPHTFSSSYGEYVFTSQLEKKTQNDKISPLLMVTSGCVTHHLKATGG